MRTFFTQQQQDTFEVFEQDTHTRYQTLIQHDDYTWSEGTMLVSESNGHVEFTARVFCITAVGLLEVASFSCWDTALYLMDCFKQDVSRHGIQWVLDNAWYSKYIEVSGFGSYDDDPVYELTIPEGWNVQK